jgi:hypothetical protein
MFRSSNVHGWPQLVVGVYGLTMMGGDVVRGYASVHVPTTPGRHTRYVQLYTPVSSSCCQRLTAWLTHNPPEFFDSKFVAQGRGREVTRVRSHGCVKVTFNVTTKNMKEWGYQVDAERAAPDASSTEQDGLAGPSRPPSAGPLFGGGSKGDNSARGSLSQRGQAAASSSSLAAASSSATSVPPKAQVSASTAAALAARRSGTNSRENSRLASGGGFDSSVDEFEAKYPSVDRAPTGTGGGSTLSQRPAPLTRPTTMEMGSLGGAGQLAPLRQGSRLLQPL